MAVSIVIKALNEEARIGKTLETALAGLARLRDVYPDLDEGEVILADSGSRDRTLEIATRFPVLIARIEPPARASCGIGPQLGFQYSSKAFVCLMDGDMELDVEFLVAAMAFLEEHTEHAGVTGHVMECNLNNLEFQRRVQRNSFENKVGPLDRMNGGGLYRRDAIEAAGYMSDRNLNGYEEFDLGVRLRQLGWKLHRLDIPFVRHFGHTENAYRLLLRRWKSRYLFGIGQLLRASFGKPHFKRLVRELPELRLWALVYGWWLTAIALFFVLPGVSLPVLVNLGVISLLIALMSWRKSSFQMGVYTVVAWCFHAAGLLAGFFRRRRDPSDWIESRLWEPGQYE